MNLELERSTDQRGRKLRRIAPFALAALIGGGFALTAGGPAQAHTTTGTLPGGTSIAVSINSPADGATLAPGPVTVTGSASIGMGAQVFNTALSYVMDVSNSTARPLGCGGDANGDGIANTILDCEIVAEQTLRDQAEAAGTVDQVGGVVFGAEAVTVDVDPDAGDQVLTTITADDNASNGPDVDEAFASAFVNDPTLNNGVRKFTEKSVGLQHETDFGAALTALKTVVDATTRPNDIVIFISDGESSEGSTTAALAALPDNVTIFTFAVGSLARCGTPTGGQFGSLRQIATATGGTCTQVTDATQLPTIIANTLTSHLTALTLKVDNGAPINITNVTPPLPVTGPATVNYSVNTPPLSAGTHTLCVTATGSDVGGTGSVTHCHTVNVNSPPTVDAGGPYTGVEGSPTPISGTATDPNGNSLSVTWSSSGTTVGDVGATCTFANKNALATTVTCNGNGVFTLTLTVSDGTATTSDTASLTVANANPSVTITSPTSGQQFAKGATVTLTAPYTDPGKLDTHTCNIDWGDGTSSNPTVKSKNGSGTCTATHTYSTAGSKTITVTITDDDGGKGTATVTIFVAFTANAFGLAATGPVASGPVPTASCPPGGATTAAGVNLPGVAVVGLLNAVCVQDAAGNIFAGASAASANVLSGAIVLGAMSAFCAAGPGQPVSTGSNVASLNGTPIGSNPATIPLGVATVHLNETRVLPNGMTQQNAVRIEIGLLGEEIIIASCSIG